MNDADFYHFTLDNYQEHCMILKKEIEFIQNKEISDDEWCMGNIKMFTKMQHYYTNYAKTNWQPKKEKNLFKIYDLKAKQKLDKKNTNKELKEKKLEKLDRPERGIDTLFRVTLNNHTQLSAIADSKANILLSVNSIG